MVIRNLTANTLFIGVLSLSGFSAQADLRISVVSPEDSCQRISPEDTCRQASPGDACQRREKNSPELIYIHYAGKKRFKSFGKSIPVVEFYALPADVAARIVKLQHSPRRYSAKNLRKQKELLTSWQDSCVLLEITDPVKYKLFYPRGLRKGDYLTAGEFQQWDFGEILSVGSNDSPEHVRNPSDPVPDHSTIASSGGDSQLTAKPTAGAAQPYVFFPWLADGIPEYPSFTPATDQEIDSVFRNLGNHSVYLGAQRIWMELYHQPIAAYFYAGLYSHYIDSIANILRKDPEMKKNDPLSFIQKVSPIILKRFPYEISIQCWNSIRKEKMDCDNTTFLVYDIGQKLGIKVSVFVVYGHALAIVGEYAYETTDGRYFPRAKLDEKYRKVYLNSTEPEKIHALLTLVELSLHLQEKENYESARLVLELCDRIVPGNPVVMLCLGTVYSELKKHREALSCYLSALPSMKHHLDLSRFIEREKNFLRLSNPY